MNKQVLIIVVCIALAGCDTVQSSRAPGPMITPNVIPGIPSPPSIVELVPTVGSGLAAAPSTISPESTAVNAPAEPTATAVSPDAWFGVDWENIHFAIPPQSTWQQSNELDIKLAEGKVISSGRVVYPEEKTAIEGLQGPTFVMILFPSSVDEWLKLEQERDVPDNPVDMLTIRRQEIAGVSAIAYQRAVKGVATIEYYALKVDNERLLWIITEDTENEIYKAIIRSLTLHEANIGQDSVDARVGQESFAALNLFS